VKAEGRTILVGISAGQGPYDVIRDTIAGLGLGLIRLEQRRQNLEDLFRTPEREEADVATR
jgi:ABC-2 type transport system ATP-binding protein